jgi:hypothetical protein
MMDIIGDAVLMLVIQWLIMGDLFGNNDVGD